MSDDMFEEGAHAPLSTASAGNRLRRTRLKPRTLAVSCVAVAALAALAWQTASAYPPAAWLGRTFMARAVASGVGAKAAPAAPAVSSSSAASGTAARVTPEVSATDSRQLAELKAAYDRLVQPSQAVDQRLDQIEADVAELRHQFEKNQAVQAKTQRQARALARQLRVAQSAATEGRIIQQQAPRVLSVDTWNGRPSVSVQVGTEIRFFSEGDVVANALVRKADPATQRVEFVSVSGVPVPARTAAGEGR